MPTLQDHGGSGVVTVRKDWLDKDGILEDGEIPDEQHVDVDRLGERAYVVRFTDDEGDLPELEHCQAIRRLAASMMLDAGALGQTPRAD